MFTGIVQDRGIVVSRRKSRGRLRFAFRFRARHRSLQKGQSVAVNGVCLTAEKVRANSFRADVVPETLRFTTLGSLKKGDAVNLEKSMRLGDEIGGHFVTGHIDGQGSIVKVEKRRSGRYLMIEAPASISRQLARKGSITVDGVSLTLQRLRGRRFGVVLIPHTQRSTTLGMCKAGDRVNLEIDLVARYLSVLHRGLRLRERRLSRKSLTQPFLKRQGF